MNKNMFIPALVGWENFSPHWGVGVLCLRRRPSWRTTSLYRSAQCTALASYLPLVSHCCLFHECKIYNIVSLKGITTLHSKWGRRTVNLSLSTATDDKTCILVVSQRLSDQRWKSAQSGIAKISHAKATHFNWDTVKHSPTTPGSNKFYTFRTSLKFLGREPRSLKNKHNFYIIRANQHLAINLNLCYKLATYPSAHKDVEKFKRVQHHGVELNAEVS